MSRAPASVAASAAKAKSVRLAAALIAAQLELQAPIKNRSVSIRSGRENYDFSYATLDLIIEQVLRPVLPSHGLWFTQYTRFDEGGYAMVTEILHMSGETMLCPIAMPDVPRNPHEAGSLISYFKRYALCAAFGLVAEDDDNARMVGDDEERVISAEQVRQLEALAGNAEADIDRLCRYMKVDALASLPAVKFDRARSALQVRRAA